MALDITIIRVAQLEALKARLRERIGEPERNADHRPPENRTHRIAPGRAGLMEADTTIDGSREPIPPRAIDSELPEQRQNDERGQSGYLTEPAAPERGEEKDDVEWHQQSDGDQETEQQFARRSVAARAPRRAARRKDSRRSCDALTPLVGRAKRSVPAIHARRRARRYAPFPALQFVRGHRFKMIGCGGALPRMRSDALSASIITPAFKLAESIIGMIEASTTRR